MKTLFMVAIALLVGESAHADETTSARVCFVRQPGTGQAGAVALGIYGSHAGREQLLATLDGSDEACVDIEAGEWSFDARSTQAPRQGSAKTCRSIPLMTETTAEATTTIEVSPKSKTSPRACGWRLRRQRDGALPEGKARDSSDTAR